MKKGLMYLVVILALSFAIATLIFAFSKPSPAINLERSLKQFTVNQGGVSGSFFLGCGSISGGEKEYYFYYKTKEGNKFRPAAAPLDRVIIIEDGQNKVVFIKEPYSDSLTVDINIDRGGFSCVKEYEFHIPKDSILEAYDPNLSSSKQ